MTRIIEKAIASKTVELFFNILRSDLPVFPIASSKSLDVPRYACVFFLALKKTCCVISASYFEQILKNMKDMPYRFACKSM